MGNGMSDYWRAKRLQDREEKIIRDFFIFFRCLVDRKPSPSVMMRETNRALEGIFENMVIK